MILLTEFFAAFFTALAVENVMFARAMDFPGEGEAVQSLKKLFSLGTALTVVLTLTSIPVYFLNLLIKPLANFPYYGAICYLLINAGVFTAVYLLIQKAFPAFFAEMGRMLPFASVNCVVFGALLVSVRLNEYQVFLKFFGYNVGAGVGFTLAMLALWCVRQRLCYSEVPKVFQGLPVMLITIGIISLSILGMTGSQLPA